MIEETLKTYRQERRCFVLGLKHYYGIDFYKLDPQERKQWLNTFIQSKRDFFEHLVEIWKENPPTTLNGFPSGYKFARSSKKKVHRVSSRPR